MKKIAYVLISLFVVAPLLAKDPDGRLAAAAPPLPTALKTAQTVYLVNAGIPNRQLDQAVTALKKWGRFTLVPDAEGSDITLTLTAQPPRHVGTVGGAAISTTTLFMSFTATTTGTVLYGTTFTGNPESELRTLQKRMDEEK